MVNISPTEESRQNLKDYYDCVLTCALCGLEYGCDLRHEANTRVCPICNKKLKIGGTVE